VIIDASKSLGFSSPVCAKPSTSKKTFTDGGALILVAAERARDFTQSLPVA
jgi:hypothetical protein